MSFSNVNRVAYSRLGGIHLENHGFLCDDQVMNRTPGDEASHFLLEELFLFYLMSALAVELP